ncbi:MAG: FMN-binding protein [Clostridia bacterium]|nr:FMN-binding protein [Clostridia bacterium]
MNKKNIKNIKPIAALTVICVAVAALLGAVNMLTGPIIAEMDEQKVYDSLREVMDGTFEPLESLPEGAPKSVNAIYKVTDGGTLKGHVVTLTVQGYKSEISLTVGVDKDGKITKAVVTKQAESHGKAGMETYTDNFEGVDSESIGSVELFSGATVTSSAIKGAVIDALNAVTGGSISSPDNEGAPKPEGIPEELLKSYDEVLALSYNLVEGSLGFEDVTPSYNKPDTLKYLLRETGGKGYVAYIATKGEYVPIANEGLVHINLDGDIVKVEHLTWIVGNNVSAEGFAERFESLDYWTLDEVELITNATVTSGDFKNAVSVALDTVTKLIVRTDKKILELVDKIVPNSKGFEQIELPSDAPATLKRVYREISGKGYVAYIVTAGQYVAVATEGLVYFDTTGKIVDAELLVWNVGHGVEPGDFTEGFIGKTEETVDTVELVTSATVTSLDFKNAVISAFPYIPKHFPILRVVGIAIILLSVIGFIIGSLIIRRRRTVK